MKWNRLWAMIIAIAMLAVPTVFAEETVSTILNAGTAQAFTDEPVAEDDLKLILESGLAAASAINQQPWYFVALTNQEIMDEIGGMGFGGAPAGGMPEGMEMPEGMQMPEGMKAPEGMQMPEGMQAPEGMQMPEGAAPGGMPGGSAKAGLGDSPVAIIVYKNPNTASTNADFDCGLACQNMVIAANALGYGAKIVSSPTMSLNGENHDAICEKLGVDASFSAVAVVLIGKTDVEADAATSASIRSTMDEKVSFVN